MAARLHRDFGEGLILGAITLLIVAAAAAEELRRPWRFFVLALNIMGDTGEALHRGLAVVKDIAERTGKHLFEPDREDRTSTRLNSSHQCASRMPSSA